MRLIYVIAICLVGLLAPPLPSVAFDQNMLADLGLTRFRAEQQVVDIIDGDTVVIADGTQVRFVGIQAPKLPLGRRGFQAWPLAEEAKAKLAKLVLNRPVTLYIGTTPYDRHNRLLAHLAVLGDDGQLIWVQQRLVRDGLARVYSFADNRLALGPLMAAEIEARQARKGIWHNSYYEVWTAQKIADAVKSRTYFGDRFEIVEGRVTDVAVFSDRAYVNFGPDWRDDFSVMIEAEDFRSFGKGKREAREFLEALQGKSIQVRGWTFLKNGPMIRLTHKERIAILPE